MDDLIQLKRKMKASWISSNPILKSGEPGFEKDTFKLKIGDGITPWTELPYASGESNSSSRWYADDGVPSNTIGVENDLYLNTLNSDVYQKGVLSWGSALLNIQGQAGTIAGANANLIHLVDTDNHFVSEEVEGAMIELFTGVSNGKELIATAITDKGGSATGSDSFAVLATEVNNLPSGVNYYMYTRTIWQDAVLYQPKAVLSAIPSFIFSDAVTASIT